MITIHNLTVSYPQKLNVIHGLTLSMAKNKIHGIVGLNGAGKTTLLDTLYGMIKPAGGEMLDNQKKLSKKEVSYLLTENFFYQHITGREYLALFQNPEIDIDQWNKLFLLPLDQVIDQYSTGMKKKLALLGVLKQDKPILILDEPFNGLDMETCRIIHLIILQLKEKGKTIIVTSHILETLTNLCDYIHLLEGGKVIKSIERKNFEDFVNQLNLSIEDKNMHLIKELIA